MTQHLWRVIASALIALTISGCATTSLPPTETDLLSEAQKAVLWQQNKQVSESINGWSLRGKIGVKTGPKGGSATLKWQYLGGEQEIELYGPFGGGRVIIKVDANGAVLRDTKGRIIKGKTASEVLYERLGWQVPFNQLVHWVRGLPSEGDADISLNDQGRITNLIQDNWQVEYQIYKPLRLDDRSLTLPTKLTISAVPGTIEIYSDKGEYLGDQLSVKVILKRWSDIDFR